MKLEQLNRLLNTACDIIISLEQHANDELKKEINAFFDEINHSDEIDDELRIHYLGDDEAQDFDVFGENKI